MLFRKRDSVWKSQTAMCKTFFGGRNVETVEKKACGKGKNVINFGESSEQPKFFLFCAISIKKRCEKTIQRKICFDIRKIGRLKTAGFFNIGKIMKMQAFSYFPPCFPHPVENKVCEKGKDKKSFPVFRKNTEIRRLFFFRKDHGIRSRKVFGNQENSPIMLVISYSKALSSAILLLTTSMEERRVV